MGEAYQGDESAWRQKLTAFKGLPWHLQLRLIVCLVMFAIEVFFVIADLLMGLVGTGHPIQSSRIAVALLGELASAPAFTFFWKSYHSIYLFSVTFYVLTIYRVSSHFLGRSRKRMAAINKSSAVVRLAVDGTFLEANAIFCDLLGYTRRELLGKHHRMVVPDHLSGNGEYEAFWERLRAGYMVTGLFERIDADGDAVWVRGTYHPNRIC